MHNTGLEYLICNQFGLYYDKSFMPASLLGEAVLDTPV